MEFLANFSHSFLSFLVIISIIVFIHEFGHYIVARMCGVRVLVFSIGFGREIFGWTDSHGTRWKFSLVPMGGYVQMFGDASEASTPEDSGKLEAMSEEDRKVAFHFQSLPKKAAIVSAGPIANFILAIIIFAALFSSVGKVMVPPVVGSLLEDGAAKEAGLMPGDRIVAIDGTRIEEFSDIQMRVKPYPGKPMRFTIEREGSQLEIGITPREHVEENVFGYENTVGLVGIAAPGNPAVVDRMLEDGAAREAGMQPGDEILKIDGEPVHTFNDVIRIVQQHPGEELDFRINRNGEIRNLFITPRPKEVPLEDGDVRTVGLIGVGPKVEHEVMPLHIALWEGVEETYETAVFLPVMLAEIVIGDRSIKQLSGPVGIADYSGKAVEFGFLFVLEFMAKISISLGVLNILPIPPLDGGHLLYYAFHAIRGKPLAENYQMLGFKIGFALLIMLMLVTTFNDIIRLI